MSLVGEDGGRWEIGPLVAYMGNADCVNPECRRRYVEGEVVPGCMDYHCPQCHKPCGMTGHPECSTADPRERAA